MSIIFKTLQHIPLEVLSATFNAAFKNYFVDISFTPEQLAAKFKADGVRLNLSCGAFHEDKLIGFIFHGTDEQYENLKAYNGGTGVISQYRGQCIPQQLYEFIFPVLKNAGVKKIILEVITENSRAINSYKKTGFSVIRKVDCYKGSFTATTTTEHVVQQKRVDPEIVKQFWNVVPTWQNSPISVVRQQDSLIHLVVEKNTIPVGYLLLHSQNGKIVQFAVHKEWRKQGIGSALFQSAKEIKESFLILNLDSNDETTASFLKKHGFAHALSQYEMEMLL